MKEQKTYPLGARTPVGAGEGRSDERGILDLAVTAGVLAGPCLVACCIEDRHPTLRGRVRVAITDEAGKEHDTWLATLQDLPVRTGDHLLVIQPRNWPEPIVAGVLDGHTPRPDRARSAAAALELKRDETLAVTDANGNTLLEVFPTADGPVVKLLDDQTNIELAGELRVTARQIRLAARQGEVTISASADVVVKGETIQLN